MIKCNLAPKPKPMGFAISNQGIEFGKAPQLPQVETQLERARDFLRTLLEEGRVRSTVVSEQATATGISESTIKRAKSKLGIVSKRKGDGWYWELPESQ